MEEREGSSSNLPEVLGFLGLAFAVIGLSEVPLSARVVCLLCGSILLPVSFSRQAKWPRWVRWLLSVIAISFLAYVTWSVVRAR